MWAPRNSRFEHSLTQIAPLRCPSVCNPAWSEHTICFCLIPIIFTTCTLDRVQACLYGSRLSAVPPGRSWGIEWSPALFLMVLEEPLRAAGWGRKWRSAVKRGAGTRSDIQGLKKTMAPLHTSAKPKIPVLFICRRRKWEGKVSLWGETTRASNRRPMGWLEKQTHRTLGWSKESLYICLWPTLWSSWVWEL